MKKLFYLLLSGPLFSYSQNTSTTQLTNKMDTGICFLGGTSWKQVKDLAKDARKYIFVDCYATWCGPCKAMDKNVFADERVGKYMNAHFISVKAQMDKSTSDIECIREWYSDADSIIKEYNIDAYPTYLFISPEGYLVHKAVGYESADNFLQIARAAQDPNQQYYAMLERYKKGLSDSAQLRGLALIAKNIGDDSIAIEICDKYLDGWKANPLLSKEDVYFLEAFNKNVKSIAIAQEYKKNHLDTLEEDSLCTRDNLGFIIAFYSLIRVSDPFFNLCYTRPEKADSFFQKGMSERLVKYAINKEDIQPRLWRDGKLIRRRPNWSKIASDITLKYDSRYANELIPSVKETFYRNTKNWREYVRIIDAKARKIPQVKGGTTLSSFGDTYVLNGWAWDIFLNCEKKRYLKKALSWSEMAGKLETDREWKIEGLDTKANLLYKLGKAKEAIALEQEALIADLINKEKSGLSKDLLNANIYYKTLTKMKDGKPTWNFSSK